MITKDIHQALTALNNNQVIGMPTETVYGLAANAFNEKAVERVFSLKQRPLYNPLIVHIHSSGYLKKIARDIPKAAEKLAERFWPGALTLILKKQNTIPDIVTSGKDTLAVRVPNHPLCLKLLKELDFPLAAPSANPFGSISPTSAEHVEEYFGDSIPLVLDGGPCIKGIESTIVGFDGEQAVIYRLGSISKEAIEKVLGPVKLSNQLSENQSPNAPGMLAKHYAPRTPTLLCSSILEAKAKYKDRKLGFLLFQQNIEGEDESRQEILSKSGNLEEAARNLYAAMHRLDKLGLSLILAEQLPSEGLGEAINDKLRRASQ